jgi:hypothetical protein
VPQALINRAAEISRPSVLVYNSIRLVSWALRTRCEDRRARGQRESKVNVRRPFLLSAAISTIACRDFKLRRMYRRAVPVRVIFGIVRVCDHATK